MIKSKNGKTVIRGADNGIYSLDLVSILCSYATLETECLESWEQAGTNLACVLYGSAQQSEMGADAICALRKAIRDASKWLDNGQPEGA